MALPNGDLITTVFDPQMAYPVDKRMQVDTLNSRDSMSMFIRWEGMEVYVLETSKKYMLQGGRSNEYWKETGTGSGTGGTTFVGQFPTADLLPTSGRSAGDYAFVGTGDDFVQYNWDNIANEWVMAEGQTDMASEFFHIGYKTPIRRPVIFPLFPKDVLVQTSGDFVFVPQTSVARFIFTGEVTAIRGIETAAEDREIKLVNRTGSDIPLRDKASGIPSGSGFDFGGSDYTWVNGSEITLKGNGTYWQLAPNNQVAFSDHLDSVNAVTIQDGPISIIDKIIDSVSKKRITLKEASKFLDGTDMDDSKLGVYYKKIKGKYFVNTDFENNPTVNIKDFGAIGDGITDDTDAIQNAFNAAKNTKSNVFAPAGSYVITSTISMFHGCTFYGAGKKQTIFRPQFSSEFQDEPIFDFFNTDGSQSGLTLKDFEVRGDQDSICGYAFRIDSAGVNIIKDIRVLYTGAGALYFTNAYVHWITDCYFGYLGRNNNSVFNEDSMLYGVIHHEHSTDTNNLIVSRVYISNCRYLNGIRTFGIASQFISVIIESLKNGYVFGATNRACRTIKIEGGYFENISQNGIKVINALNFTVKGIHNVPSSSDTFMEIGHLDTAEITHVTGRESIVSFVPNGFRSNILFKDNYRLMFPDLNLMSGVYVYENNFQLNKSYIPKNLLDNSDDFSGYSTFEGTPILTKDQEFLDLSSAYTLESSGTHQKLVLSMPSGTITGDACFSIFVKVYSNITSRIELTGNKVGGGYEVINVTQLRVGDGIGSEFQNWQRVYVSGNLDHNNIKIKIAGVPRLALARAQWEVGTLVPSDPVIKPFPYVEQDFNSFNFAPKITPDIIDLNELSETGFFLSEGSSSSFLNKPPGGLYAVNYIRPFGWHMQIAYSISTYNVYQRRYWGGSWLEWERINNINSSTTARGIIELATQTEVNAGTDDERAVTPATLQTKLNNFTPTIPNASTTQRGIIEQATDTETITGTDTERAVSPANLQAKLNALILSATATLDFPTIAAGETERLTATVTGAALLDPVVVSGPDTIYNSNNSTIDAWVSAANTVTVRVRNNGASSIDPGSGSFKIKVFK